VDVQGVQVGRGDGHHGYENGAGNRVISIATRVMEDRLMNNICVTGEQMAEGSMMETTVNNKFR
jgi:hypothetical protein